MWVVHFPNGTCFRAGLADSKDEAIAHGWMVELNAMQYDVGHGYRDFPDFRDRIEITEEDDDY
jgi:hypothetical protein